jgi:hypothetical protein
MKKTVFILLLFISFSVFGQYTPFGHFYFTGTINNNIPVQMELIIEDYEMVYGSYYYENIGEIIILDEGVVENFKVSLPEHSNLEYTGFFEGELSYSDNNFADTFI